MLRRTHCPRILLAVCTTALCAIPQGVSPEDRTSLEGSTRTSYPLGRFNARVQQLHGDLPPGLTQLRGHAYRRDAALVRGPVPGFQVELEVTISNSPRQPDSASRTFAENRGPSPTVVLPRTVVSFPGTQRPSADPAPSFELEIPYDRPFFRPASGGTICLETVVFGNLTPSGPNRNFQVYQDAHQLFADRHSVQPGFRFGQGCPPPGGTKAGFAGFQVTQWGTTLDLEISARNGVPDDGTQRAWSFLMLSANPFTGPWQFRPDCIQGTGIEIWTVLGQNDSKGNWDGAITGIPAVAPGLRYFLQVGSADLGTGALALGDTSVIRIPPLGPTVLPAARIASGSDRDAKTGTVSLSVPVTLFF